MRRIRFLVPNLLAAITMPLVCLVGCNEEEPEEKVEFKISYSIIIDNTQGIIKMVWPQSYKLTEFNNVEFKYFVSKRAKIGELVQNENSLEIHLTFDQHITQKINDGSLTFIYLDETTSKTHRTSINNISISKMTPTFEQCDNCLLDETSAFINLRWFNPNDEIQFSNFSFTYQGDKTAEIGQIIESENTIGIILNFTNEPIKDIITDGVLSFHFVDKTVIWENDCTINNIKIDCFNFEMCEWTYISNVCDEYEHGILTDQQFFSRFYFVDKEKGFIFPTSFDDFVGLKRTVKFHGFDHEVVVVDTNNYVIANDSNDDINAVFTFQFRNLMSNAEKDAITVCWTRGFNFNYSICEINKILNDPDQTGNVINLFKNENTDIDFKKVKINYFFSNEVVYFLKTCDCTLFQPHIANIFSRIGLLNANVPEWGEKFNDNDRNRYAKEDNQFLYYKRLLGDSTIGSEAKYDCLKLVDIKGNFNRYWLTTCCISDDHQGIDPVQWGYGAFCITENKYSGWLDLISASGGPRQVNRPCLCPCFCI